MTFYSLRGHLRNFRSKIFCLILGLSVPAVSPSAAEPTGPTPQATPIATQTVAVNEPWANEVVGLEFSLLETGYKMAPTVQAKSRLVFAAEKILNLYCIRGVSTLYAARFIGPSSPCQTLIDKVFALDSTNPAATCAVDGFESKNCFDRYQSTELDMLSSSYVENDDKDLEAYLASSEQSDYGNFSPLRNALSSYNENKDDVHRQTVEAAFNESIPRLCGVSRYWIVQAQESKAVHRKENSDPKKRPFDDVLDQLSHPSKAPTEGPLEVTRKRLVTTNCISVLNQLSEFDPENFVVPCITFGASSPQCVLKKKKAVQKGKLSKHALPSSEGLQPF